MAQHVGGAPRRPPGCVQATGGEPLGPAPAPCRLSATNHPPTTTQPPSAPPCAPLGVPPKMAALSLGYNICLMGGVTHYASSQAAAYYGSGFLKLRELWLGGAACGAAGLLLWGTVGMAWWKVIGWW